MTKTRRRLQRRKQQAEAGDIVLLCGDESEALPTSPASGRRPGRFCRFPHQDSQSNWSSWWRRMVRYTPQATRGRAGGTCPMAHRRVVAKACAITEQHRTRQRPTGLARSQATSSCASDVRRSRCSQNGNLLRRPCTQSAARSRDVGQDTKPGLVPWIDNQMRLGAQIPRLQGSAYGIMREARAAICYLATDLERSTWPLNALCRKDEG